MFERKKSHPPQKRLDSLIGAGTTVQGDIQFTGGLRIDGTVNGKVATVDSQSGTLVISEQARVAGEVGPRRAGIRVDRRVEARVRRLITLTHRQAQPIIWPYRPRSTQ